MERVTVLDEAMVMTIVLVKIDETLEETLAEEGSIGVSTLTPGEDAASTTTNKRKGQGKGGGRKKRRTDGRNKKVPMNAGCGVDPELGRNGKIFQRMRAKVLKARENGDGLGWYQAIAEEITKIKRQEKAIGNMLLDYGTSGVRWAAFPSCVTWHRMTTTMWRTVSSVSARMRLLAWRKKRVEQEL